MTERLLVTVARAGAVDATERARLAAAWRTGDGVLLETCHRVERYSIADADSTRLAGDETGEAEPGRSYDKARYVSRSGSTGWTCC